MIKTLPPLDVRIPDWDINDLHSRNCPICDGTEKVSIFQRPDSLIVNKCTCCGTVFISPVPSASHLNEFYQVYDTNHSRNPKLKKRELKQLYNDYRPLGDVRIRKVSELMRIENKVILDVGFGRPFLLYQLKRLKAITHGIDVDETSIEMGRYFKLSKVYNGDLCELNLGSIYDLVIMTDFIEHPLNPYEYLTEAIKVLKPGGLLLLWTPNGNAHIKDEEKITFRVDLEHMQYLTKDSIQFISKKFGAKILHLETLGKPSIEEMGKSIDKTPDSLTFIKFKKDLKKTLKRILFALFLLEKKPLEIKLEEGDYHLFGILKKNPNE